MDTHGCNKRRISSFFFTFQSRLTFLIEQQVSSILSLPRSLLNDVVNYTICFRLIGKLM